MLICSVVGMLCQSCLDRLSKQADIRGWHKRILPKMVRRGQGNLGECQFQLFSVLAAWRGAKSRKKSWKFLTRQIEIRVHWTLSEIIAAINFFSKSPPAGLSNLGSQCSRTCCAWLRVQVMRSGDSCCRCMNPNRVLYVNVFFFPKTDQNILFWQFSYIWCLKVSPKWVFLSSNLTGD